MPKILIADDEPHIRLLLEQTLEDFEEAGVEIITADNGLDALDVIRNERPELVYLDVMMPGMNGFEVCNTVKNELGIDGVYIVMLTAKGQELDKVKGSDVGADIYMTKPFNPDRIIDKTAEVLKIQL
ncbi:alkaline phosphatase synthesis transcriptional regulatory protein PhoP [bacterium BMS3Bbin06]|nr:alkaline phosphatase synthesis transcriptional regulatory protein PhoP [bacterium BMS3Bbin06]HDY72298.1 response regulator transcription factor [Nitrospirota bacterium]